MTELDGSTQPLVRTEGLGLLLAGRTILEEIQLTIVAGQQAALTGRSGSGKTSLLLILAGLIAPSAGRISWPGLDGTPARRRAQIGVIFQAPSLMPELTAVQNVALPLRLGGIAMAEAYASAADALASVSAADFAAALPAELSGGQQQRVAVARALAGRHRLILADEPTGALDRAHAVEVVDALRDGAARSGAALLLATHDPDLYGRFDDRIEVHERRLVPTSLLTGGVA